jgi:hypothetical protein
MVPLRRQLLLLATAGVLPLALLAGAGLVVVYGTQREIEQSRAVEITRAIALAVDGELGRSLSALDVLAAAPAFQDHDRAAIAALVARSLATQPHWADLAVSDGSGRPIVGPPTDPDPASLGEVLRTGHPVVGDLAEGAASGSRSGSRSTRTGTRPTSSARWSHRSRWSSCSRASGCRRTG